VKVLVLSAHEDRAYLRQLLEAGELVQAIRAVVGGGVYLDPALAVHVAGGFVSLAAAPKALTGSALSDREEEVVRLVAEGFSNKQIAAQLALSVKTVETYKARSLGKLGLRDRIDLVRYARQQGWLTPT
jgi:DNA-binding NarL/FixJ family response regulator